MHRARILDWLWIAALLALFCLHFPHLLADFPNHSPWMDYSKYTDEGWYANAAIRYHLTGHWYLRGDFNPAVALPVWPLLLALVFHFTGVSLAATRAAALLVLGLNLLLSYALLRTQVSRRLALLALTLLLTSPILYAFSRLALLEPLLMTFLLLSWLLALHLPRASARAQTPLLLAAGLLFCLMVLTKTTALFLLPSTLFLLWRAFPSLRTRLKALSISLATAALAWAAWYFLFVTPRYRADYRYLFTANQWPQPTTFTGWIAAFWYALHGTLWISPTLCLTALALLLLDLGLRLRRTSPEPSTGSRNPLIPASLLLAAGYLFFTGWHNSPQPRYYEIVIYAVCFLTAFAAADLLRRPVLPRIAGAVSLVVVAGVCVAGTIRIAGYLRHPQYEFLHAAQGIARIIHRNPGPHLLLSVSGDEISLITGLPAIGDDYGTWDLPYRMHTYRPAWYAAWNDIDSGDLEDIHTLDSLEQVAQFPAFDDPDRDLLVLYRLVPLSAARQTYDARQEAIENAGK
jgi:4-amino-4-deoxy-L-arabinose transferase-like glycosyltransferase